MAQKSNVMDRIRELDEEKSRLLNEAKNEALANAQAAVEDLNALGFHYRLVEGAARASSSGDTRKGTRTIAEGKVCPICNFVTDPPHDARHKLHRAQGQNKKPLTDAELQSAGMTKVA